MARWVKNDGTEQTVRPQSGLYFTHTELHTLVDGFPTGTALTPREQGGLFLYQDDEGWSKGKPVNQAATALLHQHRPDLAHVEVYGDVVVADFSEIQDG